jgi:hypothetical protein
MTSYKIYPSIGVARVGNAPSKFYIGPEAYRGLPALPSGAPFTERDFRDDEGRLCRQAARFRIYREGPNDAEEVTLETPGIASITWNVHVANKKASWYTFVTNEGENGYAPNHPLRNASVSDRHSLMIDAGPRSIAGALRSGVQFDAASAPSGYHGVNFPPGPLNPTGESITSLGELRTDAAGRLLVLGGHGISGTTAPDAKIVDYANNDGWWDDTADGPVFAVIKLTDGTQIHADTAWVLVGPPSYAPQIPNLVSLWDTIFDVGVRNGQVPAILEAGLWKSGPNGYRPNYQTEIQPLLERATLYPWVAAIPPKPHTFDFVKLGTVPGARAADEYKGLRTWILGVLRAPSSENVIVNDKGRTMMPFLAGDNCLIPGTLTSKYLRLTDTQYFFLQQWAAGWFCNETPTADSPTALTRGVLENCVGGAFSPGIEMSWISRNAAIYQTHDPLRINARLVNNGPLSTGFDPVQMEPGDICRYMAVPWQADFNECSSQPMDGRVIWWWPAQRPEFVYLEPPALCSENLATAPPPPDQRSGQQVAWVGTDFDQLRDDFISFADDVDMVRYWQGLGFVMERTVQGTLRFVEVARTLPRPFFPPAKGDA